MSSNSIPEIGAAAAATSDPTLGQSQPPPTSVAGASSSADPTSSSPDPADLGLVIEDDKAAGTFVYKIVDRRTGEVVQQYPREQILRMREADNYQPGTVVRAKA